MGVVYYPKIDVEVILAATKIGSTNNTISFNHRNERNLIYYSPKKLKTMEIEKIIFFRNFLFKTFIIGVLFGVFYFITTIIFWNTWLMSWIERMFKVNDVELGSLTLSFFSTLRIILAFLFLAPCIALHWMIKRKNRTTRA